MLTLLKKDFLLGKNELIWVSAFYIIGLLLILSDINVFYYIPCIILINILEFNYKIFSLECNSTMGMFLFSAPISRKDYVQSKYMNTILIMLIGIIFILILSFIFSVNVLYVILFAVIATLLFSSVFMPLFLEIETSRLNILKFIVQTGLILFLFRSERIVSNLVMPSLSVSIMLLVVSVVFFILSYRASIKIINKKEY